MRIGIDLGGTKIEALAIDDQGVELVRHRIDTPRDDYDATVAAMVGLVHRLEEKTGSTGTVGAGIPGTISRITGFVKNANSTRIVFGLGCSLAGFVQIGIGQRLKTNEHAGAAGQRHFANQ